MKTSESAILALDGDYNSLKHRRFYNSNDYQNYIKDIDNLIAQLNFTYRIQLIDSNNFEMYMYKFQKLYTSANRKLFESASCNQKSLEVWRNEINALKNATNNNGGSSTMNHECKEIERREV